MTRATGSSQEWKRSGMKDDDGIKSTSATAQDNPHSYLIRHQKKRSQSTKLRVDLTRSEIRRENQFKARPSLPSLAAGSCRENWCFATRSSWRLMCYANRLHHLHLSPSPSSIGRRRTRSLGARNSWEVGQTSTRTTPFIDEGTRSPPTKILNHPPKSRFASQNLRHVKTARYDPPVTRSHSSWRQDLDH